MRQQSRLLVVEDDATLNLLLSQSLRRHHKVDQVTTLNGAYNHIAESKNPYDAIILDRCLPDGDGLELVATIRRDMPTTKVCVTSHRDSLAEKVRGLDSGVDCYLPKPVHPEEIVAQISALLRRGLIHNDLMLRWGDLILNPPQRNLRRQEVLINLSPRDVMLLELLIKGGGRVTHDRIRSTYWDIGLEPNDNNVHVAVRRLRQRLQAVKISVATVYGFGYELIPTG